MIINIMRKFLQFLAVLSMLIAVGTFIYIFGTQELCFGDALDRSGCGEQGYGGIATIIAIMALGFGTIFVFADEALKDYTSSKKGQKDSDEI